MQFHTLYYIVDAVSYTYVPSLLPFLDLQLVSQFYAHIFFFINAVMFNSLVEQGGELGLFQHASGTALRANLNLLEGWACQVGFKDAVLQYLAKFSSAVDLLATPVEELLQVCGALDVHMCLLVCAWMFTFEHIYKYRCISCLSLNMK